MIKRLLIANRGEIARRVMRTARRLGTETVAVYSDADAHALHVREADQAVRLGPAPARESYLDMDKVLEAAKAAGADAIHPGYGFLSENAAFAEKVSAAGLTWVGPPPSAIRAMGLKDAAKRLMAEAGVAVTPGYQGEDQDEARLLEEARRIGFPVLIKAVAGGGGKGMKRVDAEAEFLPALQSAKREAKASFGDDRVLIETYITRPRHIEVQVFADVWGNAVHLFERDCSLQRRHQKVIEEAPAPGMSEAVRAAVTSAAVKAARAVGYVGAGTVEFIADATEGLSADRIYFMEMNTRLQVEHPVTEAITGLDLVEWQLRVAAGEPLPIAQAGLAIKGHAMEARLYAENPASGFLPSIGPLEHFVLPEPDAAIRVDTGVEEGDEVSPFYDPMIAKLIAWGETREAAAHALARACAQVEVWPVKTNAAFLARALEHPDFLAGEVDTAFIGQRLEALVPSTDDIPEPVLAAAGAASRHLAAEHETQPGSPWSSLEGAVGFRLNAPRAATVQLVSGAQRLAAPLDALDIDDFEGEVMAGAGEVLVFHRGEAYPFTLAGDHAAAGEAGGGDGQLRSPMPGRIVQTAAAAGDQVKKGQAIVVVEAMKMEHTLAAPFDGVVTTLDVIPGDQVTEGQVLAVLEPADA
jgi:acetyl-CoA carboxylase biotin carboxylase subunit